MAGLIGKKLGMTQLYNEKDELTPVTVVAAGPCPVISVRTSEKNGYSAVQLAFDEVPARKVNKPVSAHNYKSTANPQSYAFAFSPGAMHARAMAPRPAKSS